MSDRVRAFIALTGGGTGSLDAKPFAGISDGDVAFGMVNSLYHPYTYDTASTESEDSPYVIIPDDNVSGTGAWILGGFQGAMSHVEAYRATNQVIPNTGNNVIIFNTKVAGTDSLNEYNASTGIFTAKYDGIYLMNAMTLVGSTAWGGGEYIRGVAMKNGALYKHCSGLSPHSFTGYVECFANISIKLSATQTIAFAINQNSTGDTGLLPSDDNNWITIDRIV